MHLGVISKLRSLSKSWIFWLLVITVVAVIIRSIPAWMNAAWGNDFGIYYGLTNSMVEEGTLYSSYDGWGSSYQYFPVLYMVTALAHWITGLDVLTLMPKIAPIFGGLTVVIFYFIVYELVRKRNLALLSAGFLSVACVHVYQTSHAAPMTMGHFFMLLSFYLFIRYTKNLKYSVPLLISTVLLIMSHHLTTYFYLISLFAIVLLKSTSIDLKHLQKEIVYLSACSSMTFVYWIFVATPVFYNFMNRGIVLKAWHIMILFYVLMYGSFLSIYLIRKYSPRLVSLARRVLLKNVEISHRRGLILFFSSITLLLLSEVVFTFVNFPVSIARMNAVAIVYSLPLIFFAGLSVMGLEYIRDMENKWFFQGWALAIFMSLTYAVITSKGMIYPDRHIEYLLVPMCFISAYSLFKFFERKTTSLTMPSFSPKFLAVKRWLPLLIAVTIICSNGMAVYPVKDSVEEIQDETISQPCLNAVSWMNENLDKNNTVVATDLKLSKLLWAEGFNATFESTNETWCCSDWQTCVHDLDYEENHSRVTHILIDDIMRNKLVDISLFCNLYMTQDSYNKFLFQPFELVYRNATLNDDMLEVHWVEIYKINWRYIGQYCWENQNKDLLKIVSPS